MSSCCNKVHRTQYNIVFKPVNYRFSHSLHRRYFIQNQLSNVNGKYLKTFSIMRKSFLKKSLM